LNEDPLMESLHLRYGPWALITGASSGIGEEFAKQLARRGFHLLLCARRKDRLDHLARVLSEKYGIVVKTVSVDLSQASSHETIKEASEELDIGLVISNAGFELHGPFLNQQPDQLSALVRLHVHTPILLAHSFGQRLKGRGRGGLLLVSSITAFSPVPYLAHYAATKAWMLHFGTSLHYELKKANVDVTTLLPGITDTEMTRKAAQSGVDLSQAPFPISEVSSVVASGLRALGKQPAVVPGLANKCLFVLFNRLLPRRLALTVLGRMMEKVLHLNVERP